MLERMTDNRALVDRLQAFRARQQRLPLDLDMMADESPAKTRAKETRDELVERLLDPVLTLQETAILLDVCPTTVRRYTNRGVLNCFRTPGNQRRFRLSDVIGFMERRDTAD
jgi:excisionase family DNA binding protein